MPRRFARAAGPLAAFLGAVAAGAIVAGGCAAAAPPPRRASPPAFWLDGVVEANHCLVFAGVNARMELGRRDGVVSLAMQPALWPLPRVDMRADAPTPGPGDPRPDWYEIRRNTGIGRPYRIVVYFPRCAPGPAGGPGAEAPPPAWRVRTATQPELPAVLPPAPPIGRVEYYYPSRPPDQPHRFDFDADLRAYASPVTLVLWALGPRAPGRDRMRVVRKNGRDYFADLEATDDVRRLSFPRALLWADWSDANLARRCTFTVTDFDRWPACTIATEGFASVAPSTVVFQKVEAAR